MAYISFIVRYSNDNKDSLSILESRNEKIKIENFICSADITPEECEKGALNLMEAGESTDFRMRYWGKVTLNRHNTIIEDDFENAGISSKTAFKLEK